MSVLSSPPHPRPQPIISILKNPKHYRYRIPTDTVSNIEPSKNGKCRFCRSNCRKWQKMPKIIKFTDSTECQKNQLAWLVSARQRMKLYHKYYHGQRFVPENKIINSTCRRSNRTNHKFHVEPANCSAATGSTFYHTSTKVWNALPHNVPGKLFSNFSNYLLNDEFTDIVRHLELHCLII